MILYPPVVSVISDSSDTLDRAAPKEYRRQGGERNRRTMFVTKMLRCIYHEGVFNAMQIRKQCCGSPHKTMFSIVDGSGKSRQDGNPIAWKAKA
jgi:hypothetical protein